MKWFYNMKISAKLLLFSIIMIIFTAFIGYEGISSLLTIDAADTELYMATTKPMGEIGRISTAFQRSRVNLRDILLETNPSNMPTYKTTIDGLQKTINENMVEFGKGNRSAATKAEYKHLQKVLADFFQLEDDILALALAGKTDEAALMIKQNKAMAVAVDDSIQKLFDLKTKNGKQRSENNTALATKTTKTMITLIVLTMALGLGLGVFISRIISRPISKLVDVSDRLADGDVDIKLEAETKDEIGTLTASFARMIESIQIQALAVQKIAEGNLDINVPVRSEKDLMGQKLNEMLKTIKSLLHETDTLIQSAKEGQLDARGNPSAFQGGWSNLIYDINRLIDAFVGPINVTAEYVDRISKGDIPPKITDTYHGDFNEIKNNLNNCIDIMNGLLHETRGLVQATQNGQLDARGNASNFQGGWAELVSGVNQLINAFVGPINVTAEYVDRISKGDIPPKITDTYHGDFNEIKNNLNNCIDIMNGLLHETRGLIQATQDGQLDARGNPGLFQGGWSELVGGVNRLIDAFVGPINVTAEYVDRISKGDIPPKITDTYHGDFNEIKNNLNNCIDIMSGLLQETRTLVQATQNGQLDARGNPGAYLGGWAELVGGVNRLIDAFVGPINVTAEYVDRISKGDIPPKITDAYYGDFNEIKNNLNTCIDAVKALITDAGMLAQAAVEGRLDTRADASRHQGDFKRIVEGVNETLDAVIEPVRESSAILQEVSKGSLSTKVMGNYRGDHAQMKNAVNVTIDALSSYINEISSVLAAMSQGNMDVAIVGDFRGDFSEMKQAINSIVASLNEVFSQMNLASEQVAAGSGEVARSSQALSQASSEQASAVEEITASMTQIGAQTKQNALNANQANELAESAKENASQGNQQMQEMLKAMEEINESSNSISKIIKVIDEIAFQTNILALNAAVEAARAGQHGKGFAVVAEEVRNLAARSASAAKETTAMIEGSIKKVEIGTKIANETAGALTKIVNGITNAADLVAGIAIASNEQATGIIQVNQGINQVAQVTQMNTATAEESAAASEEMASQAEMLRNMIARFRLKKAAGFGEPREVTPDLLRMVENMIERKSASASGADQGSKIKISLDDVGYGKY